MTNKNEVLVKNQKMGDNVLARVKSLETQGDLKFPENYSPENAMKSAMLTLQDLKGSKKDGYKPALEFANPNSIANALMDMVVQGLNPAKNQGYFIMYGDKVQFQRSYLGTMAVTRRVTGAKEINAEVIFEGDEVKYKTKNGKIVDLEHSQSFGNRDSKKIIGAYATVVFEDESKNYTEIMSFEEIEEAWKQSQMVYDGKFKEDGTHRRFPQEMAKKTVINRACKKLLNSSDDSSLLSSEVKNRDNRQRKEILDAEEEANANKELLDFEESHNQEVTDISNFEEVEEIKEEPAQQTTEDEEPF
ncbi:recombinase RecT [Mammaliicoccus sciuri]|uniref:recombinase RecT n=1 Tax=Mammaliicoccus sciuri TaxID=1296 RepID=UPI0019D3FF10|nr:recombinase RecT [Mammaliicoccus sciuri]MEB8072196.1 recombinase RecT [Mammaliicoccus sciuri]QSN67045.1 recombinase RecT [Mammaliicoccus sciuri]UIU21768.1 recombinase RecT [Mammaliicoccus sciuri]UIU24668.1 recombinase RecT [Mammaliicoccus sciuri]